MKIKIITDNTAETIEVGHNEETSMFAYKHQKHGGPKWASRAVVSVWNYREAREIRDFLDEELNGE